jgi:biopolymer transport protein ExbD
MKMAKPGNAGAISFNFTPMIDVVFNLLIFFVLTAQFSVLEQEKVTLPPSLKGELKDYTQYRNVVVNVVNPESPAIIVMNETLTFPQLRELLIELGKKSEEDGVKMNVILRADGEAHYENVAQVMLAAGFAKIDNWWMQVDISKKGQEEAAAESSK